MYILNPEKSSGFRTHARKKVINKRGWITLCGSARLISPTAEEETGSRFTTAKNGAEENQKSAITFAFLFLRGILYFTFFFLQAPERWLSGRRRRSRKPLTGYSRSGVRIPLSPPFFWLCSKGPCPRRSFPCGSARQSSGRRISPPVSTDSGFPSDFPFRRFFQGRFVSERHRRSRSLRVRLRCFRGIRRR